MSSSGVCSVTVPAFREHINPKPYKMPVLNSNHYRKRCILDIALVRAPDSTCSLSTSLSKSAALEVFCKILQELDNTDPSLSIDDIEDRVRDDLGG